MAKKEETYLSFTLRVKGSKTSTWSVHSKGSCVLLGVVKWYAQWRKYCFFPLISVVRPINISWF